MATSHTDKSLRAKILNGQFFILSEDEMLELIKVEYDSELTYLRSAYSVSESDYSYPEIASPSLKLYHAEYDEVNRTLVGVLALRWIHFDDYETFIGGQPGAIKLQRESFDWIRQFYLRTIKSNEDLHMLVTSVILNDVGKSAQLAADFAKLAGLDISKVNHDMILYHVTHHPVVAARLLPSLTEVSPPHLLDLRLGILLGAELNFGQLAQAENVPASLAGLQTDLKGHPVAFDMRFMEQLLDIAGAAGHMDHTCARKLVEPVFNSYKNVYDVAAAIMRNELGLREGYDMILTKRATLLVQAGWTKASSLNVSNRQDRALMRLLCIGGAANIETADLYHDTFISLHHLQPVFNSLVDGLNEDGSLQQPAVQATYLPAMCSLATSNTASGTFEDKRKALTAIFIYLAQILIVDKKSVDFLRLPHGVTVIEKDLRPVIIPIVESPAFRNDPDILHKAPLPKCTVGKMAPGYAWNLEKA